MSLTMESGVTHTMEENEIRSSTTSRVRPFLLVVSGAALFLLAFGIVAWRIDRAPDIFTDEILYTRLGYRLINEGALVWDSGQPIVVHPPLYFLAEGLYLWLTGGTDLPLYTAGDIFSAVYQARYLNAVLAGITALVLFWLGVRLKDYRLGLLLAVLFVLDPFGVRINRRAMLETLAGLLALSGMALLLVDRGQGRKSTLYGIAAGLLMGAGILTKELVFLAPLSALLFGIFEAWHERSKLRQFSPRWSTPVLSGLIAFASYTSFPLWVWGSGNWERFARVKFLSLQRLLGLVHTSGWNRPGLSLFDFVLQRLVDYGSSYFLLALGGVAVLVLLLAGSGVRARRLLTVWGLLMYPFYGFVALFGSGNDQFFYFLLVPAIVLVGYVLLNLAEFDLAWLALRLRKQYSSVHKALKGLEVVAARISMVGVIFILALLLPYNLWRWGISYGVGVDNAYTQLAAYISENIPAGQAVNASGDPIKFRYFLPRHPIGEAGTPEEAMQQGLRYFVLAPKDVQARYGFVTPELAQWLAQNGTVIFSSSGNSYGELLLYHLPSAPGASSTLAAPYELRFLPAETAFVDGFLALLALWLVFWGAVALWLAFGRSGRQGGIPGLGAS